ncbi:MAG: hypothetical protein KatS3mg114_0118 [Planctomycetaceae bacterium]|nr:MAG: hypothetical protein KatS3mg114_0118 [Planctomycetaceae bacterium]
MVMRVWRSAFWLVLGILSQIRAAELMTFPPVLPDTRPLVISEPLDVIMVTGLNRHAERALQQAAEERFQRWEQRLTTADQYLNTVQTLREQLAQILGVVDVRRSGPLENLSLTPLHGVEAPGTRLADQEEDLYSICPLRWQVWPGVHAEGLLLEPADEIIGLAICLPDAVWTPEQFCGADPDRDEASLMPRRLAQQGFMVIIPTVISRDCTFSGQEGVGWTNQSHREWIYRQGFELGRHILGYEVHKVLAAVDALQEFCEELRMELPLLVAGVGEGGRIALLSAALDPRITAVWVAGSFQPQDDLWQQPIDRNVWRLLIEFGDAELAAMVAPRPLIIEACEVPAVQSPLPVPQGRRGGAAPGRLQTPPLEAVQRECVRAQGYYSRLNAESRMRLVVSGAAGTGISGSTAALHAVLEALQLPLYDDEGTVPLKLTALVDAQQRQERQVRELVMHTQRLLQLAHKKRDEIWGAGLKLLGPSAEGEAERLRNYVWDELIGRLPIHLQEPQVHTRRLLETADYVGYEVLLDVAEDIVAGGILLLPCSLRSAEKRPVVVCQHGLEGSPLDTISGPGSPGYTAYKAFSAELVKRGFIVYAPQNPYRGGDRFRSIQRKANPLGRSLFSYILVQHQATLKWLQSLPWVDSKRIAFYGLSYGGKTAVRVPPLLTDYCLSICSADFNEWVYKNVTIDSPLSYLYTGEYEIFEWNMGHVANYAELCYLIAPRPFMVERGHDDGVALDEWVAWEYAKVRRFYAKRGIPELTEIEFFDGPHTIHGIGTFAFLHKHLNWPLSISR